MFGAKLFVEIQVHIFNVFAKAARPSRLFVAPPNAYGKVLGIGFKCFSIKNYQI